ncbi:MAG: Acyltransferase 3 [Phenylobacterium sp.]|nr:Acyltransferase 3 [Phenylobacterium sp.]
MGVRLFFALSGRLMADILFVERFPLGEFYRRRFSRVYPGLVGFVLLTWIAAGGTDLSFDGSTLVSALTFTLNYAMAFGSSAPPIENLWSLCVEEHAYVLLGGLALLLRRRTVNPAWPLLAVAVLSLLDGLVSTVVLHQQGPRAYWRTDTELAPIFLAAAAYLELRGRRMPSWTPLAALLAAMIASAGPDLVAYCLTPALLAVAVATVDAASDRVRKALSRAPLTGLGVCSYSIYLWQHPFYRLALGGALSWWTALVLGLLAGLVGFHLVEQPARRWLNANWIGGRPAPLPAQTV